MKDLNIPVHDITPLLEIPNNTYYYFLGWLCVTILISIFFAFKVIKYFRTKKVSIRKEAYFKLSHIDFSDPKRAAYHISEFGRFFAHDNEQTSQAYLNLFERLEVYKYAPSVCKIDDETLGYYRLYLESIDV